MRKQDWCFSARTDKCAPDRSGILSSSAAQENTSRMMDYREIIQRSIDQIEDQVKDDIRVDRLAACAGFSTYHFYRVFQAYAGMPVME